LPLFAIVLVLVAWSLRLLTKIVQLVRDAPTREPTTDVIDLELAVLLPVGAVAIATHLPEGLDGPAYAMVWAALAVVATLSSRRSSWIALIVSIAVETAVRILASDPKPWRAIAWHTLVGCAFVALNGLVLRRRIERIRERARRRLEREIERMREQARSWRLVDHGAPAPKIDVEATGPTSALERVQRSGVEEIQIAVRFALDLLKRSLGAHTAILLFESTSSKSGKEKGVLRLCEVVSDATAIAEGPFGLGDGVLGAVVRRRAPVSLHGLKAGYRVPWYPQPIPDPSQGTGPSSLCAAPILEESSVRGVLCVDRLPVVTEDATIDRPFSAHEEELVAAAARYVLRAVENERVFGRLERAKAEQDQLYAAAQRLSGAITEAEVLEAGVESARAIAAFDLAAITIVHEDGTGGRTHEVRAVAGAADFESLVGLRFGDNGGLVAQAVKSKCSLPHRGDHDPTTQVVFTRRHPLRIDHDAEGNGDGEVRSILVVPLILRDRPLGTLVLGARRPSAFRDLSGRRSPSSVLEVLASHIATSLANARMFAKLEELATTDGLTGLLNKRVLLELGQQKVRAAARYGKPLSVIQTDIDHFKNINDTYGHDVGDQVIKGLAGILRRLKRATDYVARFGGEEFVVICEETDAQGALQLAERVREELARTTFHAQQAGAAVTFQVTCSLGVATFPTDGQSWDTLYKATDDALYVSKRTGRNRTTVATSLRVA
jgi:diguanylate cyclase (GGDEF)-like protein